MADTRKLKRLRELSALADLAWQGEAARFAELTERDSKAAAKIATCRADRAAFDGAPPEDRLPRSDQLWQVWTDRQIAELNRARAMIRAEMEAERPKLKRAFGRREALRALIRKLDR